MEDYFEGIDLDDAELIESLSRVTYELRENRKQLLEIGRASCRERV